jgi:hypothetical protein
MIPPTIAESSTASLDASTTTIIFECSDFKRDIGLILLKQKKDPSNKFELHMYIMIIQKIKQLQ